MLDYIEKHYAWLTAVASLLVLWLNYDATAMQGIIPYYHDFARIIAAGFDPSAGKLGAPTFPVWGYGWIYLLLRTKIVILLFQQALALAAILFLVRELALSNALPQRTVRVLKLLLPISLPLFGLNSVLWPYSIAASLLALAAAFILRANRTNSLANWIVSGVLLGLMLNFRSDFILFPPLLPILALLLRMKRSELLRSVAWVACVYAMLLPWGMYTRRATGHFLLTSTNSGQVLFASLGQLPGNKWGITTGDGDPVMLGTVHSHLGAGASSLSYEASQVLRDAAIGRVIESPGEYGKKVIHGAYLTLTQGFYPGSFYETGRCLPNCYAPYKAVLAGVRGGNSADQGVSVARALLQAGAVVYSRALLMLCFLALPFAIAWGWKHRSLPVAVGSAAVIYQAGITTFTHHLPGYTSNVYIFHLLMLAVGWSLLTSLRGRNRAANNSAHAQG